MTDLVDFLNARLDEAEERIRRVLVYSHETYRPGVAVDRWKAERTGPELRILRVHAELPGGSLRPKTIVDLDPLTGQQIARYLEQFDPDTMLRDIEAKRRIIEAHHGYARTMRVWIDPSCAAGKGYPCPTLRMLALPYAEHDGYREEWRV